MSSEVKEPSEDARCNEIDGTYKCGACHLLFPTLCRLHTHLKTHGPFEFFYFLETTKTGYLRFGSSSISIQTDNKSNRLRKRPRKNSTLTCEDLFVSRELLCNESVVEHKNDQVEKSPDNDTNKYLEIESQLHSTGTSTEDSVEEIKTGSEITAVTSIKLDKKTDTKISTVERTDKQNSKKSMNTLKIPNISVKLVSDSIKASKTEVNSKFKMDKQVLICKLCKMKFEQKNLLRNHIKHEHSGVSFLCMTCGECCQSEAELIEHRRHVHGQGYYKCELCHKVLCTKRMLDGHYMVHKGIRPFSCDICQPVREFTRKSQLKAHMETHSTEKTLQCEYCGKSFNARYLMMNHVKHCGGIKPFKCEICDMKFISNHCLQQHRRTHTGEKPYICEICAFASSNASCLARHMRTHTGEKPFKCKHCNQMFAAPGALKKHVRIHTQEKPYKCKYCSKAFTQNWNLKTHERQHTGETPYKCHVCGMGYKQNVLLKTHLKTHLEKTGTQSTGSISTNTHSNLYQNA
ncbi:hypothetical protein ACF0H5_011748 [Mactra antiquata]